MNLEIELTYLAKRIPPGLLIAKSQQLVDIYIPEETNFPSLRLRKANERYEVTKKVIVNEGDFSTHNEYTIPLQREEYETLSRVSNKRVIKKRFKLKVGDHEAEIDIFEGQLKGLVLIDFEFKTSKDKSAFKPPQFCLADVTQEPFVLGNYLAGKSFADIEQVLEKFKYRPLFL